MQLLVHQQLADFSVIESVGAFVYRYDGSFLAGLVIDGLPIANNLADLSLRTQRSQNEKEENTYFSHNFTFWAAKLRKKSHIIKQKHKKMHFFFIFLQKNLVMSKKSSTFAPAFESKAPWCREKSLLKRF
jgi:hypothetical protein